MKNYLLILSMLCASRLVAQTIPSEYLNFYQDLETVTYEEKFKRLEEVITHYPEEPWFIWMRASVYDQMGEEEKAMEEYQKSLDLDSNFSGGHASLARFIRYNYTDDQIKMKSALKHINRAIELEPDDEYYKIDRGYIYLALKEFDKAEADADYTLSLVEFDVMAAQQLKIETLYQSGKKAALKEFVQAHDLSNEGEFLGTNFCIMLAEIYEELGDAEKSCKLYHGASQPYIYMEEEIPDNIKKKLKKCK